MDEETQDQAPAPEKKGEPKRYVLQLILDAETYVMTLGGTPIPICLGQMMVDEASRILATMRVRADQAMEEQARGRQAAAAERTRGVLSRIKQ